MNCIRLFIICVCGCHVYLYMCVCNTCKCFCVAFNVCLLKWCVHICVPIVCNSIVHVHVQKLRVLVSVVSIFIMSVIGCVVCMRIARECEVG